jgi:hypothetical protein
MTQHFRSGFGLPRNDPPGGGADYTVRGVLADLRNLFMVFWRGRYWIAAAVFLFAGGLEVLGIGDLDDGMEVVSLERSG